jgi:hypothetical protein
MPAMLAELHDALGENKLELEILPLVETDRLFEMYAAEFQRCLAGEKPHLHLRAERRESGAIFSHLHFLGKKLGMTTVAFFGRTWQYTGAAVIPAGRFFPAAETLLRLEVDELRAASSDGTQGVLIDHLFDHEQHLELWCWGAQWSKLAREEPEATH